MFAKSTAYLFLGSAFLISLALVILRPTPEFNYDFDQFFPQQDPDLDFYRDFKDTFENDNDYLLLAFDHSNGDWRDSTFLSRSLALQSQIRALDGVDSVISVLDLRLPIIGVFGLRTVPVLNWDTPQKLAQSENRLDPYRGSLISEDGKTLLFLVKNQQNISKEKGDQVYAAIQEAFQTSGIELKSVAGKIQAQGDFVKLMQSEFGLFLGLSFLLILVVLTLIYRHWLAVFIPILVLLVAVAWAFAWIILSGRAWTSCPLCSPPFFSLWA